jgi:hypothetical protein
VLGPGLNGLVDGVGRAVFGMREDEGMGLDERRVGSVPARGRLADVCRLDVDSGIAPLKSGKLSAFGDSRIVSRRGVEWPLVGGPHT